jgi:hypothetical protein
VAPNHPTPQKEVASTLSGPILYVAQIIRFNVSIPKKERKKERKKAKDSSVCWSHRARPLLDGCREGDL